MSRPHFFALALGNPGVRYALTRHNAGWIFADWAVGSPRAFEPRIPRALVAEGHGYVWVKPLTWMNLSGEILAVLHKTYPDWEPRQTVVIYDDVALPLGRARFRLQGSAGGHRGMASVLEHLGHERIPRLRIGIGPVPPGVPLREFVLSPFQKEELDVLLEAFPRWLEGLERFAAGAVEEAQRLINTPQNRRSSP